MPSKAVSEKFDLETRNKFTKVECEVIIKINGRELPNATIVGEALDKCIELIQEIVTKSYEVPSRVDTPMATNVPIPKPTPTYTTPTPTPTTTTIMPEPKLTEIKVPSFD